jgi:intergrase/recombinase
MNEKSASSRISYANQFAHVLQSGDAQPLLQLSPEKRLHVMKALTCLSKFLGCHDTTWIDIKKKYNLKWSVGNNRSLETFERCYGIDDSYNGLDKMLQWLRQMRQELPESYSSVFVFCTLTGLRTNECFEAIRLIKDPETLKTYYQASKQTLEHFRFPELFIRRTKAAYISLVNEEILDIARNNITISPCNYMKVMYMVVRSKKLKMNMHYCRKIYSSYLRQYAGIESEIIDLLQGRTPNTVFAKHYFRPNLQEYNKKVLDALTKLKQEIER